MFLNENENNDVKIIIPSYNANHIESVKIITIRCFFKTSNSALSQKINQRLDQLGLALLYALKRSFGVCLLDNSCSW